MDAQQSAERFSSLVQRLLNSPEYSDFTLVCEGRLYRLHKAIVCPQSVIFAAMLQGKFKEGLENSINLPEDDVRLVHCMIRYLYGFNYDVEDQFTTSGFECVPEDAPGKQPAYEEPVYAEPPHALADPMHALVLHARMCIIADTYMIEGLKAVALRDFDSALKIVWDPGAFVQAADLAYTWTRDGDVELRNSVVRGVKEHKEILTDEKWKPALQGMGPLMYDVVRSMLPSTWGGVTRITLT